MSLQDLASHNLTDKNTIHSYLPLYDDIFKKKKETAKNILEIGIGWGYSIKLWNDYFKNATIYGLDILHIDHITDDIKNNDKIILHTSVNAYNHEYYYDCYVRTNKKFDIVIDDGPHTLKSMKKFIRLYGQVLTDDGLLVIEDIESIDWIDILKNEVPNDMKQYIKVYDLRHIKGRYDDIVFTIDKLNV